MKNGRVFPFFFCSLAWLFVPCTLSAQGKATVPSTPAQVKPAKPLPTLLVFNIIAERGVDQGMANLITEVVSDKTSKLGRHTVIGQKDLDKMLSWEQRKQTQGCKDYTCLIQMAGALGASFYVEGSIGVMGDMYLISLKLIDANDVKVLSRSTEKVAKDENAVVSAVERQVAVLFGISKPTGPSAEEKTRLVDAGIGLTFSGIGIAAIGGVMTYMAFKTSDDYNNEKDPRKLSDDRSKISSYNGAAVGLYVVGGAAAVTGAVLWGLYGSKNPSMEKHALTVLPGIGTDGGSLCFAGTW